MIALLVCAALVLPKASAALALVLPTYGQTLTICTPDGIVTITLDANGVPVDKIAIETAHCLAAHADLPQTGHAPQWHRMARQINRAPALHALPVQTERVYARKQPSHAPPRA